MNFIEINHMCVLAHSIQFTIEMRDNRRLRAREALEVSMNSQLCAAQT